MVTTQNVASTNAVGSSGSTSSSSAGGISRCSSSSSIIWNLFFCFLAWACNVSTFTLVIGTSNNVFLSIGGNVNIASIPLGAFFLGSAVISCGITEPLFRILGRRYTFVIGILLGLLATLLGCVSLVLSSPTLNIISTFFFGTANGIGYYLRFAVIETVPNEWAERAVTLVVSGGIIAAFAGPEAGHAAGGMFGGTSDDRFYYMGIFLVTGVFCIANLICIAVIPFQPVPSPEKDVRPTDERTVTSAVPSKSIVTVNVYKRLLINRNFHVPMLRATTSWIIMVVPMSVLRIAMRDAGYTTEQSLRAVELHFCGMYAPGFVTGGIIQKYGVRTMAFVGHVVSCISISVLITCKVYDENDNDDRSSSAAAVAQWMIGMFLSGVGWNFQFTSTTVWLNRAVDSIMHQQICTKGQIQSANDFLMFLLSGICIFGASFVYNAGVSNGNDINNINDDTVLVSGWRTLNYYVIVFLFMDFMVILLDYYHYHRDLFRMEPKDPIINHISPPPTNRVQDEEQPAS